MTDGVGEIVAGRHRMMPDGESTERWAFREPGFMKSIKQLLNCARCGDPLPPKPHNVARHFRDVGKPTIHCICDDCHDALPE